MEINIDVRRLLIIIISLMIYFCAMLSVSYAFYQVGYTTDAQVVNVKTTEDNQVYVVHDIYGKKVSERITDWDLSETTIDDNIVYYIKLLSRLKTVDFGSQVIDEELLTKLINTYPQVKFIYRINIGNKSINSLTSNLDLSNTKINDYDKLIKSMTLLTNLKTADFSNSSLSNEELDNLRKLFPNVDINWVVHLGKWSVRTDAISFSVLIYHYDYVRMTSKDIEVLKYCTKLQALDLGHQAITDISVIGDYLPNLRILILADNKVGDITPLKKLKHLHYLELFINPLKDITPLKDLKELVDVNFCYCWGINDYSILYDLPHLERIWLVGTHINREGINTLKEKHPDAQIVNTGAGSTNSGWRTHERYFEMIKMYHYPYYLSESFTKYDNI